MSKTLALEMERLSPYGPTGGTWRGGSFTDNFDRKVRFFFYQEAVFIGDSERYVTECYGNWQLSQ